MMPPDERRLLEEAAARAWPHREELWQDGWRLRFSGGGSKRANSVQTLGWSGSDLGAAVDAAEAAYRGRGHVPVFQIVDISEPAGLDAELVGRGYSLVDRTLLMVKAVGAAPVPATGFAASAHDDPPPEWFKVYLSTVSPDRQATAPGIIAGLPRPRGFFVASDADGAFAVGLGVAEGPYCGIECMATRAGVRQRGGGRAVMAALESWAAGQGVQTLWLQVVEANAPARRLYEGLGYRTVGVYWYRVGR